MSTLVTANIQNTGDGAPTFKNTDGTEIGQLARAWMNFSGSGTVSIHSDFNINTLTDNGTGDYTITFSNSLSSANYSVVTSPAVPSDQGETYGFGVHFTGGPDSGAPTTKTTSTLRLKHRRENSVDISNAGVAIFGV